MANHSCVLARRHGPEEPMGTGWCCSRGVLESGMTWATEQTDKEWVILSGSIMGTLALQACAGSCASRGQKIPLQVPYGRIRADNRRLLPSSTGKCLGIC